MPRSKVVDDDSASMRYAQLIIPRPRGESRCAVTLPCLSPRGRERGRQSRVLLITINDEPTHPRQHRHRQKHEASVVKASRTPATAPARVHPPSLFSPHSTDQPLRFAVWGRFRLVIRCRRSSEHIKLSLTSLVHASRRLQITSDATTQRFNFAFARGHALDPPATLLA